MSEKSYHISSEKKEGAFIINLRGEFLLSEMDRIRDSLIQHSGGHESVILRVYPDDELSVAMLQVLLGFKRMSQVDIVIFMSEASEQFKLLEKSGFSTHFEIKN